MRLTKLFPRVIRRFLKDWLRRGVPPTSCRSGRPARPPSVTGPVRLLSSVPPVFISGMPYQQPLGIAREFARRYGNVKAGFIIFPTWSIEWPAHCKAIHQELVDHVARWPNHRFLFICNTPGETRLLEDLGIAATFLNKNFMVSDQIFRPIANSRVEFDAVYNARFVPWKRHELATAVPRVCYLTYIDRGRQQEFRELYAAALERNPDHVLLNELMDGVPSAMTHKQVNAALGRAAVGLILSEVEGSSYASMEYLLAGLPVVSTPSKGGRDVFFDPEYCIVCDPDAAAVREAVATLLARNIPRELIRARTLAKIQPERQRFLAVVDDLTEELGGERQYSDGVWPFGDTSGVPWLPFTDHLAAFAERLRSELGREFKLDPDALINVQLEAGELRPIATAIRERPGCALLVFGCGNDSPFWETVNGAGTTVFLEDDRQWADDARARLEVATVHAVTYGTTLSEWPRLLDCPSELVMELPEDIESRRWDVILVDGPAGHSPSQPGRMKSIYAAARLVAPGGIVFVHDCERPAEQAFTSRYLGDHRLFIEAKGRAVLRGYGF